MEDFVVFYYLILLSGDVELLLNLIVQRLRSINENFMINFFNVSHLGQLVRFTQLLGLYKDGDIN